MSQAKFLARALAVVALFAAQHRVRTDAAAVTPARDTPTIGAVPKQEEADVTVLTVRAEVPILGVRALGAKRVDFKRWHRAYRRYFGRPCPVAGEDPDRRCSASKVRRG